MGYFLIATAAILRLLPHAPNFAPVTAIALFGGTYLKNKRLAFAIPLAAMLVSDIFIGFYSWPIMVSVYASFALSGLLGLWLRGHKDVGNTMAVTLASSIQFYLLTNFAVWAFGTMYPHNAWGLLSSYINALPFFRNTLYGDFFYVGLMFGLFELVKYFVVSRSKKALEVANK
ncbi:MAG: hypothetical protein Q8R08_03920 [bacterium]|nr:hypothetical protein [bacterium]